MDIINMDWGFIMEVALASIACALIAVAGSVLINAFSNRKGYKDIDIKIGNLDNTTLSGEHKDMKKAIEQSITHNTNEINSKIGILNNTTLSGQNENIMKSVEDISKFLEKEKEQKKLKNSLLNYDLEKISTSIDNLSGFASNMEDLCAENAALKAEVEELKQENKKVVQENIKLKEQLFENQNKQTNHLTQNL